MSVVEALVGVLYHFLVAIKPAGNAQTRIPDHLADRTIRSRGLLESLYIN